MTIFRDDLNAAIWLDLAQYIIAQIMFLVGSFDDAMTVYNDLNITSVNIEPQVALVAENDVSGRKVNRRVEGSC